MVKRRKDVLILLKVLEDMLENLGATEYQGLITGEGYLVYEPKRNLNLSQGKPENTLKRKDDFGQHEISVEEFIPKLLASKTKEEAQLIIPQKLKKVILLEIASVLSVHVQKNDTKEKISYKIIESVVGTKLRSKAIKDTELRKKHMDF